jgi:hypothetical protein
MFVAQQRKKAPLVAELEIENEEDKIAKDCNERKRHRTKNHVPGKHGVAARRRDEAVDRAAKTNGNQHIGDVKKLFQRRPHPGE